MSLSIQRTSMTLLAGALVLSLSACASRPVDPDSRMGRAGEKLGQAGQKIGEVSSDLWVKTKHVFRMDGTDAYHGSTKQQAESIVVNSPVEMPGAFKDEVDLALVQDEFDSGPGLNDDITITAIGDQSAELIEDEEFPGIEFVSVESPTSDGAIEELIIDDLPAQSIEMAAASTETAPSNFPAADLDYEVRANENLWDISKKLTGDATNWQQLAALNSLDNNGTVYGGQKLQIPGDMLKPEYGQPSLAAATPVAEPTLAQTSPERLIVPTATVVETVSEIAVTEVAAPAIPAGPSTSFKVQAGESMWDLAKRTTGDATNWKNIAAANGMSPEEAALIKYGQSLDIPNDLLKEADEIAEPPVAAAIAGESSEEEPVVEVAETDPAVSNDAGVAVLAENTVETTPAAELTDETLTILPANFKSEPTVINGAEAETKSAAAEASDWIMVSGTYYPKAVYNDANFSATLLTRVSPGTKLQVSRAIGPWFEVKTDRGLGYVHSRDIK